jgi:hypothetical protein
MHSPRFRYCFHKKAKTLNTTITNFLL